ncbi:NUDIX hydrolase [Planktotalea sp.]|uniref:NUDIX hydrolase n=1 Tax=Planktotalea sp. TaxID=2029877 RepID=UPI003D6C0644
MSDNQTLDLPHLAIDMLGAKKTGLRTQFAALCFRRRKGKLEILLVTSRRSRRWIIPKGWPQDGLPPSQSAAVEAMEEAGVEGKVFNASIGAFSYTKRYGPSRALPCVALVYPLKVKKMHKSYREAKQRKRKWFSRAAAAKRVTDPELAFIIRTFDPKQIAK